MNIFFPAIANKMLSIRTISTEIVEGKEKIRHSTKIDSEDLSSIFKILAYNSKDLEIDDLFFIKKGSRNLERQGINIFKREELIRFINKMEEIFMSF